MQMRPQLAQPRPHALRVGRQIKRPQRTHLAMPDEPASVSTRTIVLSKTVTDFPPDHL